MSRRFRIVLVEQDGTELGARGKIEDITSAESIASMIKDDDVNVDVVVCRSFVSYEHIDAKAVDEVRQALDEANALKVDDSPGLDTSMSSEPDTVKSSGNIKNDKSDISIVEKVDKKVAAAEEVVKVIKRGKSFGATVVSWAREFLDLWST